MRNENCRRSRPDEFLEARGGIEPPIKVLQTFALPLGDRATESEGNQTHEDVLSRILTFAFPPAMLACVLTAQSAPAARAAEAVWLTTGAPIRLPHSVQEPS